jgi:hypothetical protein
MIIYNVDRKLNNVIVYLGFGGNIFILFFLIIREASAELLIVNPVLFQG